MGCIVHVLLDIEEIVSKSIASSVRIKFVESSIGFINIEISY